MFGDSIDGMKAGVYVRFLNVGGYDSERVRAAGMLGFNQIYKIEKVEVGGWSSRIYLEGFPNIPFNHVMFEVVEDV